MDKEDLSEYKRKYDMYRHHAWAGLGFLSVLLAIRIILPELSELVQPILFVLIVYIMIALILTYKYRRGLTAKPDRPPTSEKIEKQKIQAEVEKERLKIEKKKAKAEAKARKKSYKE